MAEPMILVPGLLCDDALWRPVLDALAGASDTRVPDVAGADTIGAMADVVLAGAPPTFALAGFSMGGLVALEIVARAPARVTRLGLLSANAGGITPVVREHYHATLALLDAGRLDDYLSDAFPRYVAPDRRDDPALRDAYVGMARRIGAARGARQMRALLAHPGFLGDLGAIGCPTTVVCGREDQRVPVALHEAMTRRIPGCTLRVIERSGHFTPLEQPAAVADAIATWRTTPRRP